MSCDNCLASAIKAKLGQCPWCVLQAGAIALVAWGSWWWCGADTSINALTALLFAVAASTLLLLHVVVFISRWVTGHNVTDDT